MKPGILLLIRIIVCIFVLGVSLYANIRKTNDLTLLRLAIPSLEKEVKALHLENERLQYEIDRFESPLHLMELLRKPEYSHLKHPFLHEIFILSENEREEGYGAER